MDPELFDTKYEDESMARMVDEICLSCPVMKQCLMQGVQNNETTVWGGFYLVNGKTDPNKNKHKTPTTLKKFKDRMSND